MPERLEIEPAVLRALANQHEQVARETREWAQPPREWLDNFQSTYGKIADPVRLALVSYYNARQRAGEALAQEHEQTAASLRASADEYERMDAESAANIRRVVQESGIPDTGSPSTPQTMSPVTTSPAPVGTPITNGATPVGTPGVTGGAPIGDPLGTAGTNGTNGMGAAPTGASAPEGTTSAPSGRAPASADAGLTGASPGQTSSPATAPNASAPSVGPNVAAASTGDVPPSGAVPGAPLTAGPSSGDDRGAHPAQTNAAANADDTPIPVAPTPFGAAVAAAKEKEAAPDYVVGEEVNEDLVIARTLLGAVLAAVDSTVGMNWAVSVMRGPAGAGIFITSNEGRGWLPAGIYLPREVSTPWLWDEMLRSDDSPGSPWEGISDPARVLVEFGLAWGAKANAQLSALVSSGPIDPGLRANFTDVPMQGLVGPSYDVDLRVFTPDTVDRLGISGTPQALDSVAAIPDDRVQARCLELALDANAQLSRSVPAPVESAGARAIRNRILAQLESGTKVPQQWWEELREADDLIAAAMISHRVDVGRVGVGELRADAESTTSRTLAWERRCNELVALLEQEVSRQTLRDAVYAHEQVVGHPSFVAVPAAVSTPEEVRTERPTTDTGVVSASAPGGAVAPPSGVVAPPTVTAGPPPGAVTAPGTQPPDVSPQRE
ncbi:type VII secretion target [Nocardia paucivorans]|uniref:type VII secretion target n=1 Tax=Nocardia paucivorans TaxID=114259 RepID=UPI0002DE4CEF|nr:type VII secretion target [Nocardia paucivorans]